MPAIKTSNDVGLPSAGAALEKLLLEFIQGDQPSDTTVEVVRRHIVVVSILRCDALTNDHHLEVSLIGVYRRHSYANVRVYACQDDLIRAKLLKQRV